MTALLFVALLQDFPSRSLPAHPQRVAQAQLSPDGKLALTLGEPDRVLKVWRLESGKVLHTLGEKATSFALRPDGGLVALATEAEIGIWNLVTGEAVKRLDVPRAIALGWSGDALTIVAPGPGGLVATSGERKVTIPVRKVSWAVVDGLRVAVPHEGQVRVWDVAADKVLHELPGRTIAFGTARIATAGDGAVHLDGKPLDAVYENTPALAWAGDTLLVGTDAGIEVWDGGRRRPVTYRGPATGLFYPSSMGLSGGSLYAGGSLILKDAPASGRVTGPLLFWKLR